MEHKKQARKLSVDRDGRERGTRGTWEYPVSGGGRGGNIAEYEGGRFECHFHPETELTLMLEGEMYYRADDRVVLLHAGDAVFVNSDVMHAGWQSDDRAGVYTTVNFSTQMVYGHEGSRIEQAYVEPLLRDNLLPALVLFADREEDAELLAAARELYAVCHAREEGYELLVKAAICRFWRLMYLRVRDREEVVPDRGVQAVKRVIAYMEAHYAEKLTLEELAGVYGLSRSEFCRSFHRITSRTPFSFLQHLRVRRSLPLLRDPALSITEVAERVGFSGASYYAEIFRRFLNVSPLQYRKREK